MCDEPDSDNEPLSEEDILRFARPAIYEFETDTAEFYRWFEYGGRHRERPLDFQELVIVMMERFGYSRKQAELTVLLDSDAREGDKMRWEKMRERRRRNP